MPQIIEVGRELIRINPQKNVIEYSKDGKNWIRRGVSFVNGILKDLCLFGPYIYAVTSKGVYYSKDNGLNWSPKTISKVFGDFQTIMASGTQLLAQTSKGLYYSKDGGINWSRK